MPVIGKKNKVNLMFLVTLASLTEREVAVSVEFSSDGQPHVDVLRLKLWNPMALLVHLSLNEAIMHLGDVSLTEYQIRRYTKKIMDKHV